MNSRSSVGSLLYFDFTLFLLRLSLHHVKCKKEELENRLKRRERVEELGNREQRGGGGRIREGRLTEDTAALSIVPGVSRKAVTGVEEWGLGVATHVVTTMQVWVEALIHICAGVLINY